MKIWGHPYLLKPRHSDQIPRRGALLKVQWQSHLVGYSDLHPWPEFGEAPLDSHLESFSNGDPTPLAEISLEYSYLDAQFRRRRRNAFLGLVLPKSHLLVHDADRLPDGAKEKWSAEGYSHLKIKLGARLKDETKALEKLARSQVFKLRLDFNGKLTVEEFTAWWSSLSSEVRQAIDFVEDPIAEGDLKIAGPWADDWYRLRGATVRIIKPAREELEEIGSYRRVVFTHSLDHPLGLATAVWSAAQYYKHHPEKTEVCGLSAPNAYELNAFSKVWSCEGPRMKPTPGTGFGFDDLLESIRWERIF